MSKLHRFFMARRKALAKAWRTFWWMVVTRPKTAKQLSRRIYLRIAIHEAWCGLLTGGEHWWGPLRHEYEGALRRKRKCRLCRTKMTPAEEFAANPPTPEQEAQWRELVVKPTDKDVEHAVQHLKDEGLMRDGKILWEK